VYCDQLLGCYIFYLLKWYFSTYLLQLDELKSFDVMQVPFQPVGIGPISLSEKLDASGHIPE